MLPFENILDILCRKIQFFFRSEKYYMILCYNERGKILWCMCNTKNTCTVFKITIFDISKRLVCQHVENRLLWGIECIHKINDRAFGKYFKRLKVQSTRHNHY